MRLTVFGKPERITKQWLARMIICELEHVYLYGSAEKTPADEMWADVRDKFHAGHALPTYRLLSETTSTVEEVLAARWEIAPATLGARWDSEDGAPLPSLYKEITADYCALVDLAEEGRFRELWDIADGDAPLVPEALDGYLEVLAAAQLLPPKAQLALMRDLIESLEHILKSR